MKNNDKYRSSVDLSKKTGRVTVTDLSGKEVSNVLNTEDILRFVESSNTPSCEKCFTFLTPSGYCPRCDG